MRRLREMVEQMQPRPAFVLITGDLIRDAIARGTPLGRQAKSVYDSGGLVRDDLIMGIVREELKSRYPDFAQRREAWYRLLDTEILPALRRGERPRLKPAAQRSADESGDVAAASRPEGMNR